MYTTQTDTPVVESSSSSPVESIDLVPEKGTGAETDYFALNKIGATLRLESEGFYFPDDCRPKQALALSHNPTTLFLAHRTGFYVAKAECVLREAKAKAESGEKFGSVANFSINVQIGMVRMLSVSTDNSTLAASGGREIHFFNIASLLNNVKAPLSSSWVDESSGFVSDFRWRKNLKSKPQSFLVLSSNRILYHGELGSHLRKMRDNVDAVDWSTCGDFIAVGQKNYLTILSETFTELRILSMPHATSSLMAYGADCYRKVDSINWIRPNCIFLGVIVSTIADKDVDYEIQVIDSEHGQISQASSKPVELSFKGLFASSFNNSVLPFGCGPNLFLNYLENGGVALVANKKSTKNHVHLFCWSLNDKIGKATRIHILRDLPREFEMCFWEPPLIEDRDDHCGNSIVGFGVVEMSLYNKVKNVSGGLQKGFSHDCILLCVTIDAKLLLFHFEDVRDTTPYETGSATSDEKDISGVIHQVGNSAENQSSPKTGFAVCYEDDMSGILHQLGTLAVEANTLGLCMQMACLEPENYLEKYMKNYRAWKGKVEELNERIQHNLNQTQEILKKEYDAECIFNQNWDLRNNLNGKEDRP